MDAIANGSTETPGGPTATRGTGVVVLAQLLLRISSSAGALVIGAYLVQLRTGGVFSAVPTLAVTVVVVGAARLVGGPGLRPGCLFGGPRARLPDG